MPSDNPDPSPQPVATWNQQTYRPKTLNAVLAAQSEWAERRKAPIAGTKEESIIWANGTSRAEEGGSNPIASITALGDAK